MALCFFRREDPLGPGIHDKRRNTAVLEQGHENIDLDWAALVEFYIENFSIHALFETPHDLKQGLCLPAPYGLAQPPSFTAAPALPSLALTSGLRFGRNPCRDDRSQPCQNKSAP